MSNNLPTIVKLRQPKREFELIREKLKHKIDEMPEEEVKLLSYRLRLESITKEMIMLEDDIEKLKNKRKGCQNDN